MAKKALGRGLSNLIPGGPARTEATGRNDFKDLNLDEVRPDPNQPRKTFDETELQNLAATFKNVGIIEPIIVRPIDGQYRIISGERRWRAAGLAGFKKIPAILKQVNDTQAMEMAIIENIQREELNPVEEARAYMRWMEVAGIKASDIAKRVGKDRSTITNLLRLLKLPDEILVSIENGFLTPGQTRPLLSLGDTRTMLRLSARIAKEGWNARKVEDEIARLQSGVTGATGVGKSVAKDANIRAMEDQIRRKLMTRVSLKHKSNGSGSITLHYGNLEDLERLLATMGVQH
ncbi:MAG: ParB/RepB/Spo0J family partition protein [Leptospiraceae bacterium]|nr:ParB/RepB/Spo0J family partition protein [Leptospiraceae bacterium]